jgi:hypothetical protein
MYHSPHCRELASKTQKTIAPLASNGLTVAPKAL